MDTAFSCHSSVSRKCPRSVGINSASCTLQFAGTTEQGGELYPRLHAPVGCMRNRLRNGFRLCPVTPKQRGGKRTVGEAKIHRVSPVRSLLDSDSVCFMRLSSFVDHLPHALLTVLLLDLKLRAPARHGAHGDTVKSPAYARSAFMKAQKLRLTRSDCRLSLKQFSSTRHNFHCLQCDNRNLN